MTGPASGRLLLGSFAGYHRSWARGDVVAGLTVWAVLVPESLAYATIAGVPPVVGLYAAVPALVLYAVLGSSRHLVVSPMSATAALSAGIVADVRARRRRLRRPDRGARPGHRRGRADGRPAAARVPRVDASRQPVLKGFIIGLALTILVGQLPKLFGVPSGDGNFFEKLWHLVTELDDTSVISLTVGLLQPGRCCSGCAAGRRWSRARWSSSRWRSWWRASSTSATTGSSSSAPSTRACRPSPSPTSGCTATSTWSGPRPA